ncbi:hypothetical protein TREMEDRAFT_61543 [Tremella mesenterica DSM 1558]|uniref:uncharacterized protein n=1 Tax=Tremella mesenterica (strain ATCC 24925 / CBS 8224 / DSM 1558 / NBRC 9311 / NRRL Y-6157 / RJB 2259-6 / UBC 559-6) TaxID=578456 RepID=UPI0003F4A44A|nr:uncharacterized protein TREMEDRAFT_61543 [Tremella mesenterica DSM 1558]EIW69775.1 hypothetical protein TREMEDRAFT_61543 [Tremella mesenterica DSM 1558]
MAKGSVQLRSGTSLAGNDQVRAAPEVHVFGRVSNKDTVRVVSDVEDDVLLVVYLMFGYWQVLSFTSDKSGERRQSRKRLTVTAVEQLLPNRPTVDEPRLTSRF